MGCQNTFQLLSQIFGTNRLDNKLLNELKLKQMNDKKATIKIYLLQFLLDPEKDTSINSQNDLWYIKDNPENKNIINNYISLLIYLLKKEENELDDAIIKSIESFLETNMTNKIFYISSILNKFNMEKIFYLLYLGFILGNKKEFIKNNYVNNLRDLLIPIDTDFCNIISKKPDFFRKEKTLEILNLYVFFNLYLKNNYKSINSIKNYLINLEENDFNISKYYSLLYKEKLLDSLFFKDTATFSKGIFKKKELIIMDSIKIKIKEFNDKENENNENLSSNDTAQEKKVPFDFNDFLKINNNFGKIEGGANSLAKNGGKNKLVQRGFEESNGNMHDNKKDNNILSHNIENEFQEKENKNDSNVNSEYINNKTKNNNKISDYLNIIERLYESIDFPKKDELNITEEEEDIENNMMNKFIFILNATDELSNLRKTVGEFKYFLKNWLSDIPELLKKIKNKSNFKLVEITNLRLEFLINFLKSPKIINIKRKIIEIMILHLYYEIENEDVPTTQNINNLEKIINIKSNNDLKKDDIVNLQRFANQKEPAINKAQIMPNEINNNNIHKKNKVICAKNFLEYYKTKLNYSSKICENKSQFNLLPRNMFSTETKVNQYLSAINKKGNLEKDSEENKIVGIKTENKIIDMSIYKEIKLLVVDDIIDILFSFNSKINDIENNAILQIEQKQKEFENDLVKIYDTCKGVVKFEIKSSEFELDYDEEIVKQINNYIEIFEKDVLHHLSIILNSLLFDDEINNNDEIINKLNSFLNDFIKNCNIKLHKLKGAKFKDVYQLLYYIIIKNLMVQKMKDLFENMKKKVIEKLVQKEKEFNELTKIIKSNLNNLKKYIEEKCQFESLNDMFLEWNKKENYYFYDLTLDELKRLFKEIIIKEMNL